MFNFREFIEELMGKKVTPLHSRSARTRSPKNYSRADANVDLNRYPFHEISPDLNVRISHRAKRIALRLDPRKKMVHLVIPRKASLRKAYNFANDNREWIQSKIQTLTEAVPFLDGAEIPFLGQFRTISVNYDSTLKRTSISLKENEIIVSTNKEDPSSRIERFLIKKAGEELKKMANEKAKAIGKKIAEIKIKDTSTRWGSCSEDGKISLSWRLALAPSECMDYVVAHEVAHLVHMNHSKDFWELCDALSYDMEDGKYWMGEYGNTLLRYGEEA
jgi:predicted metal-dependent hydrolase